MHPVLFELGPLQLSSYAGFMILAFAAAFMIRRVELRRLGHKTLPGYHWVPTGALVGAMIGAKAGMLLFTPVDELGGLMRAMLSLDFSGKTVVGGLIGGYVGVEVAKKIVGIRQSTGDAFAVAVPVAQAIGRLGCLLNGCCYGQEWAGAWALPLAGVMRHPAPLYEAALNLALAAWLWRHRERGYPNGHLFRRYLVGYAAIRFSMEFLRGDNGVMVGPLTAVQLLCLGVVLLFGGLIIRGERDPAG